MISVPFSQLYKCGIIVISQVNKCGIIEAIQSWMRFKQQAQLSKKCSAGKTNKIKGIPKLDDANDAGTKNSTDCTLILTEGDSAKTLAVAGLGVVGRDRYGVFPLRGKLLNVREASHKQVSVITVIAEKSGWHLLGEFLVHKIISNQHTFPPLPQRKTWRNCQK